jgi:hypothetical protein
VAQDIGHDRQVVQDVAEGRDPHQQDFQDELACSVA